jgi:pSer/pThr/pTyr-binding forkhead associated (FHA) protein
MLLARLAFRGTMSGRRRESLSAGRRDSFRGLLRGVPARTAIQKFAKDAAMITCERCQTENIEGSQYCDECGGPLPGTVSGTRAHTSEHASAEPDPVASDSGAARRAPAAELRAVPQPLSAAGTSVAGGTGRVRAHEDSPPARRDSDAAPHAKLVIHRGRSVGKEFPLCDDEAHIGRWDADGGIFPDVDLDSDDPEAKVSRRHARITRRAGQYYIEDLGSTNGTFVNRQRRLLPGDRQPLRDGDEVIVGKTFLKFHVLD